MVLPADIRSPEDLLPADTEERAETTRPELGGDSASVTPDHSMLKQFIQKHCAETYCVSFARC